MRMVSPDRRRSAAKVMYQMPKPKITGSGERYVMRVPARMNFALTARNAARARTGDVRFGDL